jgi:hypothetical protein
MGWKMETHARIPTLPVKVMTWGPSTECLYREIGGAKQLCSEFRLQVSPGPGYAGTAGFISFDKEGRVTVAPGFVWDGASGPTLDTLDSVCAALGHDVMYELMRLGKLSNFIYKPVADLWFYNRLRIDGMIDFRAWAWYRAVQAFGGDSTDPENQHDIKRAPLPFPSSEKPKIEMLHRYAG